MEYKHCLNCGENLNGKYCSNCGQKTNTHRITFQYFVFHDIMHGVFHFEKGMLFTAKQALLRPGKAALEYIAGKRVYYYNIFYFILLLIGVIVLISHLYGELTSSTGTGEEMNEAGKKLESIFSQFGKLLVFLTVPLTALNSYIIFKRKKLNFSEHIVISGMLLLGTFLLVTFFMLLAIPSIIMPLPNLLKFLLLSFPFIILIYIIRVYQTAFKSDYNTFGFSYRMTLFLVLLLFELSVLFILLMGIASNWGESDSIIYSL